MRLSWPFFDSLPLRRMLNDPGGGELFEGWGSIAVYESEQLIPRSNLRRVMPVIVWAGVLREPGR